MTYWHEALKGASAADLNVFRPVIFRPAHPADRAALEDLLKREPRLTIHDQLPTQLLELVKAMNPAVKFTLAELKQAANAHCGSVPSEDYGVWVHYPWSHRLVHLLDEQEFALVRTDRNRNKITREEQATLGTKKVGVIGLSVGQSVSLALAMERSFGELRLADFDTLDLSNLNRIRSGVHHLGVNKVVNTAREIAELDPFLRITAFLEGINEANIERFLTEGGKLDLLIEECDSVAVKILARQKAKAHRIPVVMDTSDRGLIDVERFDLEPERPILHGLVEHLDLSLAAKARTNEEKLPFVVPIIGLETMSTRMKASMLEIESTVGTWPQLASSVVLGGALVADIHRRIALGQFTRSGRWYVDSEELIADGPRNHDSTAPPSPDSKASLGLETMTAIAEALGGAAPAQPLSASTAEELVQAAIMAPSAGNLQPWRFLYHDDRLLVFHDAALGDSQLDDGRLIPAVDMGTCLENLRLRASALGVGVDIRPYPTNDQRLVALVEAVAMRPDTDALHELINQRCTNRRKGDGRPVPPDAIESMRTAARGVAGCDAHVITEPEHLMGMAELIGEAERIRVLNPIGHFELFEKEMRWSAREATAGRDGLDLATMELKKTEEVGFHIARDRKAMDLLAEWDGARGFMKMTRDNFRSASGLVLISATDASRAGLLQAGRAVQRVWLSATASGLSVHPCAAPILLAHHVRHGSGRGMDQAHRDSLLALFQQLCGAFGLQGHEPVFMLRLSHADAPTARSLRRPVAAFMHVNQPSPA
ncbi:MAG: Rv1355c family protein [Flavobacteriales bacterium]|nr:Rv1355c family protein [Flavobacteriales bacterium]